CSGCPATSMIETFCPSYDDRISGSAACASEACCAPDPAPPCACAHTAIKSNRNTEEMQCRIRSAMRAEPSAPAGSIERGTTERISTSNVGIAHTALSGQMRASLLGFDRAKTRAGSYDLEAIARSQFASIGPRLVLIVAHARRAVRPAQIQL